MMHTGQARGQLPQELDRLLSSEMARAIEQANLGRVDEQIAWRYLIDRAAQADIAAEVGYERSAVSRRLKKIKPRVVHAASHLPPS